MPHLNELSIFLTILERFHIRCPKIFLSPLAIIKSFDMSKRAKENTFFFIAKILISTTAVQNAEHIPDLA